MSRLFACIALAALASPAVACINDSELAGHEREFRSQYRSPAAAPAAPESGRHHPLLYGAGGGLLLGAFALASAGRRAGA